MKIVEVLPKENFTLYIRADDGKAGVFDVKPYLISEVFAPLNLEGEFARIHNGGYYVEWDCGADISADTIEANWILEKETSTQPSTAAGAKKRLG